MVCCSMVLGALLYGTIKEQAIIITVVLHIKLNRELNILSLNYVWNQDTKYSLPVRHLHWLGHLDDVS